MRRLRNQVLQSDGETDSLSLGTAGRQESLCGWRKVNVKKRFDSGYRTDHVRPYKTSDAFCFLLWM